jgi:hypothetical protein
MIDINYLIEKCVPVVSQPGIVEVDTFEQSPENDNQTTFRTRRKIYLFIFISIYFELVFLFKASVVVSEQENVTVTSMPELEFTTRTNRTNRLEVLEEYYSNVTTNSTNEDHFEETTIMEIKEIVVLSTNASSSEEFNRTNITYVEQMGKERIILYQQFKKNRK